MTVFEKNNFEKDQRVKANSKPFNRKLFSFSHGIYRSRYQRIFELQKSIIYRWKGLKKGFSIKIFSVNVNWKRTIEKTQKPWNYISNMVCQWKFLNDSGLLYIIRKVIKRRLRWYYFLKRWLKLLPSETSNMVYVTENFFDKNDMLYIIEKFLKNAIQ